MEMKGWSLQKRRKLLTNVSGAEKERLKCPDGLGLVRQRRARKLKERQTKIESLREGPEVGGGGGADVAREGRGKESEKETALEMLTSEVSGRSKRRSETTRGG